MAGVADTTARLHALLLAAKLRLPFTQGEVRAYVESQRALSTPKRKAKKRGAK